MTALEIAQQYYASYNRQDWQGMMNLVHPQLRHEPNQGEVRIGLDKFREFIRELSEAYHEELTDLVFFTEPSGKRIAVEFTVNGIYKKADEGFPAAHNQRYVLPAAAFLEIKEGKISRVTTYYNLPLWIKLVS